MGLAVGLSSLQKIQDQVEEFMRAVGQGRCAHREATGLVDHGDALLEFVEECHSAGSSLLCLLGGFDDGEYPEIGRFVKDCLQWQEQDFAHRFRLEEECHGRNAGKG